MKKTKRWIKKIISILRTPEISVLPGQISFFLMLSLIPIISLIVYFASLFAFNIMDIIDLFENFIPKELLENLSDFLSETHFTVGMGISMIVAFFLASNGSYSMIVASNFLYKEGNSSYLTKRIKAVIMTILLVFLVLFILLVVGFGNSIMNFLVHLGVIGRFKELVYLGFYLLKWPFTILTIFFTVKILYTMAPDVNISSKQVTKSAIFTTISWTVIANIYSFYVSNFSSYDAIYGNLATVVILMMVLYIFSYLFVIGIAMNAEEYERYKKEKTGENKTG